MFVQQFFVECHLTVMVSKMPIMWVCNVSSCCRQDARFSRCIASQLPAQFWMLPMPDASASRKNWQIPESAFDVCSGIQHLRLTANVKIHLSFTKGWYLESPTNMCNMSRWAANVCRALYSDCNNALSGRRR